MSARGETVTVERPNASNATNKYGDKVGQPTQHKIRNVVFAPSYTTEDHEQGNRVTTRLNMYGPAKADLKYTDVVIRSDGSRWRVEGKPFFYENPFTHRRPGFEAVVEQVRG